MSTKTLRKRIALTAVTALGAGLLSVVSTPVATAANNATLGGTNAVAANDVLNIATEASVSGAATLGAAGIETGTTSLGLLANSTTQTAGELVSTATLRADGAASFYSKTAATKVPHSIVVTGGTVSAFSVASGGLSNSSVDRKALVVAHNGNGIAYNFTVTPDVGATTVVVNYYIGTAYGTADAAALAGTQAGTTSRGTLSQRYTITIGSTALSGVFAADKSIFQMANTGTSTVTGIDDRNAVTGSASVFPNGVKAQINYILRDAFGTALPVGAIAVSASAGGVVSAADNSTSAGSPANSVAVATASTGSITIAQAVANVPATVTVTVTRNGLAIGSKTVTFLGEVAKVTVTPAKIGKATSGGTSNAGAATIAYADSAGNALYPVTETSTVVSSTLGLSTVVSAVSVSRNPTSAPLSGLVDVTCVAGGTVPALQMRHINSASGTTILSNTWSQSCAGTATSMTASFDKASYAPGTIATLTLSFKDAKGFTANAYDNVETITITGAPSAAAITPIDPAATKPSGVTGNVVLQYVVGSTTGDFVAVVVPSATLVTAGGTTPQANLSVAYKVATTGTTVTNEQVLASIVSLIASINKQIVALQKLILQRR
jgi:trimeric autotransporter adhesin